jgi:hypothetical protein
LIPTTAEVAGARGVADLFASRRLSVLGEAERDQRIDDEGKKPATTTLISGLRSDHEHRVYMRARRRLFPSVRPDLVPGGPTNHGRRERLHGAGLGRAGCVNPVHVLCGRNGSDCPSIVGWATTPDIARKYAGGASRSRLPSGGHRRSSASATLWRGRAGARLALADTRTWGCASDRRPLSRSVPIMRPTVTRSVQSRQPSLGPDPGHEE